MVITKASTPVTITIFVVCFALMLGTVCALGVWLLFAHLATAKPTPSVIVFSTWMFIAGLLALAIYFWTPLVCVVVSWVDVVVIVAGIFPGQQHTLSGFIHQFCFNIVFFVAAHIAWIAHLVIKKRSPDMHPSPAG
jgi:hypothetical protein